MWILASDDVADLDAAAVRNGGRSRRRRHPSMADADRGVLLISSRRLAFLCLCVKSVSS